MIQSWFSVHSWRLLSLKPKNLNILEIPVRGAQQKNLVLHFPRSVIDACLCGFEKGKAAEPPEPAELPPEPAGSALYRPNSPALY